MAVQLSPVAVAGTWSSVSLGVMHTCGIRATGGLACWGMNSNGQLGDGDMTTNQSSPKTIGTSTAWTSVTAGGYHSCALASGAIYCWGYDNYGQLGDGGTANVLAPKQVGSATTWTTLTAGGEHTCGTQGGSLYCWGWNQYNQLGSVASSTPELIGTSTNWGKPALIGQTSFCLTTNATTGIPAGELFGWGDDHEYELGDNSSTDALTPERLP